MWFEPGVISANIQMFLSSAALSVTSKQRCSEGVRLYMWDIDRWHLGLHTFFHQHGKQWSSVTAQSSYSSFAWERQQSGAVQRVSLKRNGKWAAQTLWFVCTSATVWHVSPTDSLITVGLGNKLRHLIFWFFSTCIYSNFCCSGWTKCVGEWEDPIAFPRFFRASINN